MSGERDPTPRKLRIAIVAPSMATLGGQAVQADRLLRSWRSDDEVEATLVPVDPAPPALARPIVRTQKLRTAASELVYLPSLVRAAATADVLHVFSRAYRWFLLASLPAIAAGRALGRPVLLHHHNGEARDHLSRSVVARAALGAVTQIVVPSPYLQGVLREFGLRSAVVPNVIELDRFPFRSRDRLRPRLLSTRNLHPIYDIGCTLRAFAIVQRRHPDAMLTLAGAGTEERALRALAASLQVRHVEFRGRVSHDDMPALYDGHDVYVQSPILDNAPNSIVEAFASGLPVVATRAGGVPALVDDGALAQLAPVGDHEALAALVLDVLQRPDLACATATAARAACERSVWAVVRAQWLALYRRMASAEPQTAGVLRALRARAGSGGPASSSARRR